MKEISSKQRIFINIFATYGHSLLSLFCGVFSSRWLLAALGEVDLGLFGVIGGLTVFIKFLNDVLSISVGRYYGVAIGYAYTSHERGLQECKKWFNSALFLHTIVPLFLISLGYPIGIYSIKYWLVIPNNRIITCILIFKMSCIACYFSMATIPFYAMYRAKQKIAELAVYSIIETIFRIILIYYMVTHPGVWLGKYGVINSFYQIMPNIIIAFRAYLLFPECKPSIRYLWNPSYIRQLLFFSGFQFLGSLGFLMKTQGIAILANKFFGPSLNASISISNTLSSQTMTLASSLSIAFSPAIQNAYGYGDYQKMRKMSYFACKMGTLLVLIFAIPLLIEIDEVLKLWLGKPPQYVKLLCQCSIISIIIDRLSNGHMLAINAVGKVAIPQLILGTFHVLTFPIALICLILYHNVYAISIPPLFTICCCSIGRIYFADRYTKMSSLLYIKTIFSPIIIICISSLILGKILQKLIVQSFFRIIIISFSILLLMLLLSIFLLFDLKEREQIIIYINRIKKKIKCR